MKKASFIKIFVKLEIFALLFCLLLTGCTKSKNTKCSAVFLRLLTKSGTKNLSLKEEKLSYEKEIDHSKVGAYKITMPKAFDKILMLGLTKMKDELHEKVVHEAQLKKEAQSC